MHPKCRCRTACPVKSLFSRERRRAAREHALRDGLSARTAALRYHSAASAIEEDKKAVRYPRRTPSLTPRIVNTNALRRQSPTRGPSGAHHRNVRRQTRTPALPRTRWSSSRTSIGMTSVPSSSSTARLPSSAAGGLPVPPSSRGVGCPRPRATSERPVARHTRRPPEGSRSRPGSDPPLP